MSNAAVEKKVAPQAIYLKDYAVPTFLIDEIHLDFNLDDHFTLVTALMQVRHNRLSDGKSRDLVLAGEELILESIALNGQLLQKNEYQLTQDGLIIPNVPDKFTLAIVTKIFPQQNTALTGLYRSHDTYCTQCEAEGFRRITYYLDQPDILARFTTVIHANAKKYPHLLSNGNLVDAGTEENERHWVKWEDPFKKPSYLFALVAGDFDIVQGNYITSSDRTIELKIYVEKGYGDQADHTLYSLKEAMRWDEKTYGREYDLDIYMIVAIGDFNMGAMENKGLNIFNTKYALAKPETATDDDYIHILSVVGHEYFHNWSGNRVTCRDWFQLSLKEGLTIFRDQTFTEDTLSPAVMRIREVSQLRETQFAEDASPLAHPVRPDSYIEINNFYTATVYNKGAEVLRMLRTILGNMQFRKGMDLYFARHDGQAVTIEEYVRAMEDVSGIDLTQFRLWYDQAGTPIVSVTDDYDGAKQIYTLFINQSCPKTPNQLEKKPLFIPIRMGLLDSLSGEELPLYQNNEKVELEQVLRLTKDAETFQFKNISSRPVPSLLRNFSAPVILNYAYTHDDYLHLVKHDSDAFNRWEAGQKFALHIILDLVRDYQQDKQLNVPVEFIHLFEFLLQHQEQDKFFLAEMLALPSEKYIGEQMEIIDVDAIHAVREFLLHELVNRLHKWFVDIYQQNHSTQKYQFNMEEVGKRQLKNRCLSYLMLLEKNKSLGLEQFEISYKTNMTDAQAALITLVNLDMPERMRALELFYEAWQHDALVLDKWFSIQAISKLPNTLQQVKKLVRHPAFDLKNPNKVYALIGAFTHRNAVHFHAKDGEGYAFLRDIVQQLDKLNPQIAARMVKPLTLWQRYDKERQELIRTQLELLMQDTKISRDLFEIVSKTLGE